MKHLINILAPLVHPQPLMVSPSSSSSCVPVHIPSFVYNFMFFFLVISTSSVASRYQSCEAAAGKNRDAEAIEDDTI